MISEPSLFFFVLSQVAHVGSDGDEATRQSVLRIFNIKSEKEPTVLPFDSKIVAVKMNRLRIVVVQETRITIMDTATLQPVHIIESTPKNPKGIPEEEYVSQ